MTQGKTATSNAAVYPAGRTRDTARANVPSADIRLPAVRDYEQAEAEIRATLHPTVAWFRALAVAIALMLVGAGTWMY